MGQPIITRQELRAIRTLATQRRGIEAGLRVLGKQLGEAMEKESAWWDEIVDAYDLDSNTRWQVDYRTRALTPIPAKRQGPENVDEVAKEEVIHDE